MKKSLYQLLGVKAGATSDDIASAYKDAVEKLTEDGNDDRNQRIILREAFAILSHPQKRAAYDASLATPLPELVMREAGERRLRGRGRSAPLAWFVAGLMAMGVVFWWYARKPMSKPVTVISKPTVVRVPVAATPAAPASVPDEPAPNASAGRDQ